MKRQRWNKIRQGLEARRAELRGRLAAGKQIDSDRHADPLEEARADADRELAILGLDSGTRRLHDVEMALRRIQEGTYGICVRCEEEIGEKRLAAVPWSALCLDCQRADEESGAEEDFRLENSWFRAA